MPIIRIKRRRARESERITHGCWLCRMQDIVVRRLKKRTSVSTRNGNAQRNTIRSHCLFYYRTTRIKWSQKCRPGGMLCVHANVCSHAPGTPRRCFLHPFSRMARSDFCEVESQSSSSCHPAARPSPISIRDQLYETCNKHILTSRSPSTDLHRRSTRTVACSHNSSC